MSLSKRLIEETSNTIVSGSVVAIISSIPLVLLWGFPDIESQLVSESLKVFSAKQLLTLLYILSVAVLLLLTWIHSYKNTTQKTINNLELEIAELTKLTPKNGIYWDNQGNAYCANQKHLMSPYNKNKDHYHCRTCNILYAVEPENKDEDDFPTSFSI